MSGGDASPKRCGASVHPVGWLLAGDEGPRVRPVAAALDSDRRFFPLVASDVPLSPQGRLSIDWNLAEARTPRA